MSAEYMPEGETLHYFCGCVLTVHPDDGSPTRAVTFTPCNIDCSVLRNILVAADKCNADGGLVARSTERPHDDVMVAAAKRRKPCVVTDEAGQIVTAGTLIAWRGRNGYRARVNDGYVTRTYSLKRYHVEITQ